MQKLNTLWQLVSTVSDLRSMIRHTRTYYFSTIGPVTIYLRADAAEVRIMRWALPKVEITAILEGSFGWRVATDQDDAGVYVVARRKPLVGRMSSAAFSLVVPHDAHLMLNIDDGRVVLEHMNGTLHIPAAAPAPDQYLLSSG